VDRVPDEVTISSGDASLHNLRHEISEVECIRKDRQTVFLYGFCTVSVRFPLYSAKLKTVDGPFDGLSIANHPKDRQQKS
jgi:hypothetical protein